MKAIVTGGGSGGHIYPAISVAQALKRMDPSADVRFLGGKTGMETEIVPPTGLPFHAVTTKKLRRLLSPGTVGVLLALCRGFGEAKAYLRSFSPDFVVSTGGYAAAATALAAARLRIPTVIVEPNAVAGRTNLWVARFATKVCIWFDEAKEGFPPQKVVKTGVPIRSDIVSGSTVAGARLSLGLHTDTFTLLVMGGSQGAKALNEIVLSTAGLLKDEVQILHQVGANNIEQNNREAQLRGLLSAYYHPRPYLSAEDLPLAYRAADLVLCRCGVGTLAEVAANGLPSLLVPLPTAYADHQTANARAIVRMGGGILLPQSSLTAEALAQTIRNLTSERERLAQLAQASQACSMPDAADGIARLGISLVSDARRHCD